MTKPMPPWPADATTHLDRLPTKEREVLKSRLASQSRAQIAARLGYTPERIRSIERAALNRLHELRQT